MVGNTGNLMTMRNKVHSQDDTVVSISTKKSAENENGVEHKPQSSFKRGPKHLSISFRLPKNQHNFDDDATNNQASNFLGKSRFFINHFNYHHHHHHQEQQSNNKNQNSNTTTTIINNDESNQVVEFTRTSGIGILPSNTWVFPPHAPTPNIYHCLNTQELLAANDNGGFKGFRKQFSGRFKRLVAAKKPEPSPVIPPHLKPQLKTIYVY